MTFAGAVKLEATATCTSSASAAEERPNATRLTSKDLEKVFMMMKGEWWINRSGRHRQNDVRCLDQCAGLDAFLQVQRLDAFVGDDGRDRFSARQLDHDLCIDGAFLAPHNGAGERVACAGLEIGVRGQDDPLRLHQREY